MDGKEAFFLPPERAPSAGPKRAMEMRCALRTATPSPLVLPALQEQQLQATSAQTLKTCFCAADVCPTITIEKKVNFFMFLEGEKKEKEEKKGRKRREEREEKKRRKGGKERRKGGKEERKKEREGKKEREDMKIV